MTNVVGCSGMINVVGCSGMVNVAGCSGKINVAGCIHILISREDDLMSINTPSRNENILFKRIKFCSLYGTYQFFLVSVKYCNRKIWFKQIKI